MSYREIFRIESVPVFQNKMFATEAAALACPTGDVVLVQDMETGLVFNAAFEPDLLAYDHDYQNEQAYSAVFQRHLEDVIAVISRHFHGKSLIEVGCGKGYFLEYLRNAGYEATGIDPAYEGANPYVVKAPFALGLGLSADGIVLRHVLEHIPDPVAFLSNIAHANGGTGRVYIEIPCFDWICRRRAWFDVYYEHVNYFRLADFYCMFGAVHEAGYLFAEQYLYVVADLATLRVPGFDERNAVQFPADFLAGIEHFCHQRRGKRTAIWGAAAKGTIVARCMKRAGAQVDFVIDINPSKQGKFLAGSGLRVTSPEEAVRALNPGDEIAVMNSNYLDEITAQSDNRFNYLTVD